LWAPAPCREATLRPAALRRTASFKTAIGKIRRVEIGSIARVNGSSLIHLKALHLESR